MLRISQRKKRTYYYVSYNIGNSVGNMTFPSFDGHPNLVLIEQSLRTIHGNTDQVITSLNVIEITHRQYEEFYQMRFN